MKTHSFPTTVIIISSVLLLATTGCPGKNEPKVAQANPTPPASARVENSPPPLPTSPAAAPVSDPAAEMANALANATIDQHEGISAVQQRMDRSIDDLVLARKSAGANVSLAADEKLDNATEVFAEKLRMLTLASSETWASAKHDATLALQSVRSAFAEAMNSPSRQ